MVLIIAIIGILGYLANWTNWSKPVQISPIEVPILGGESFQTQIWKVQVLNQTQIWKLFTISSPPPHPLLTDLYLGVKYRFSVSWDFLVWRSNSLVDFIVTKTDLILSWTYLILNKTDFKRFKKFSESIGQSRLFQQLVI